jgi:modulator of FtsH protease HflC
MARHSLLIFIALAAFLLVTQSAFIVTQGEQAMVLQFGNPVMQYPDPGLKFKTPFVQNVKIFSKKILGIDPDPEEVILADQKRLVVDTFGRYKITDMLKFNNTLATEDQARQRIENIINSMTREVLGTATLADVLSEKRSTLMFSIRDKVNAAVNNTGVEIVDVRIGRADLSMQTSQAIYDRMRTERQREAAQFRGEGQRNAQEIKSRADKERTIILAEAEKQAQILRGEGDEGAIRLYAQAFSKDAEFYSFYRTMQAYREGLPGDSTTLILSPDSDFFRYFNSERGHK